MREFSLGEILGRMELEARFPDGRSAAAYVILGRPQEQPGTKLPRFWCPWKLEGYGSEITRAAPGLDPLSAILAAFEMIGIELEAGKAKDGVEFMAYGLPHGFPTNYWPKTAAASPDSHADAAE